MCFVLTSDKSPRQFAPRGSGKAALPDELDLSVVADLISAALDNLLAGEANAYRLKTLEVRWREIATSGAKLPVVVATLETDDRPLVLGQFAPLSAHGLRGFHDNYVYGYVRGFLRATHGTDFFADLRLVLNVDARPRAHAPVAASHDPYRIVSVAEALAHESLLLGSPLHETLKRYDLRYVLTAGPQISGPSYAMVQTVGRLCREHEIRSVLDLYAGTCALAKVALVSGAERATSVDVFLDRAAINVNLGEHAPRCALIEGHVERNIPTEPVDLVVLDPFYDSALHVAEHVVPELLGRFTVLVLNAGPPEQLAWVREVQRALRGVGLRPEKEVVWGETVLVCHRD